MTKFLYALLVLITLLVTSIYIFIPNQIVISKAEQVESSERIIVQYLTNSYQRREWWPEKSNSSVTDTADFQYESYSYTFNKPNINFVEVLINDGANENKSILTWTPVGEKVMQVNWRTSIPASYNPIKRFFQYLRAREIKANMDAIMESFLNFIVNAKNVYGHNFKVDTVRDTILATSTINTPNFPETQQVYRLINSVKKYVEKQSVKQVNAPMLNISKNPQGTYQTMIAIPVEKRFKPAKDVLINFMVPGNILVTEIKGGPNNIEEGFNQMTNYMKDFKLTSPAIPFQLLITDRSAEADTSKWITKIYYPIY